VGATTCLGGCHGLSLLALVGVMACFGGCHGLIVTTCLGGFHGMPWWMSWHALMGMLLTKLI
jgi:hypothetical protein